MKTNEKVAAFQRHEKALREQLAKYVIGVFADEPTLPVRSKRQPKLRYNGAVLACLA